MTVIDGLLFEGTHLNEIIWLWIAALIFLSGVAWWWFIEGRR
jgi:Na+(H+)/acetate symporter ActP